MLDKHLEYLRLIIGLAALGLAVPAAWPASAEGPPAGYPTTAIPGGDGTAAEAATTGAPTPRRVAAVIEDYVREGLNSNLVLANQSIEVAKGQAALAEARARFFPELALSARYTRAEGGRQIVVPAGQLLNPVYQTLNDMLAASGAAARFPPVADESIPLQLTREQDTRVTLRQPLYAPAIAAGVAAARANLSAADYARQAYQRELRRDITVAYLEWLRARDAVQIVAASESLLAENLRVNQSLYDNGSNTRDVVLRARAEWLAAQQQQREAANSADQARSYLNFLLNRPLDTALEPAGELPADAPDPDIGGSADAGMPDPASPALNARPDLLALDQAQQAAAAQLRAARAARQPNLALGVDAGTEGVDYGIGHNYNFVTGSLVLSWTLFDAGARAAAISQARLAGAQLANQRAQLAARISLELQQARDNLRTAADSLDTANAQAAAARAVFALASRRRDAGMASQLEYLDARSELTRAELNRNTTHFSLLERESEYAYARGDPP